MKKKYIKHIKITIGLAITIWYFFFSLPNPIFDKPLSTVIFDKSSKLLGAKLADDEQWRFPIIDSIPYKYEQCVLNFEDEYFFYHPGFNPISISKALVENLKAKKVVRGGSTISMQTIRLAREAKSRTIYQKVVELILATRLELRYSKDEILKLYVSNTPYGGNIVGLQAASWRYYKRKSSDLSWAESATLAVLPNAPSLIYPGKNHNRLLEKRNRLLNKLFKNNVIDSVTCFLALQEPIPIKPKPLPNISQHLLNRAIAENHKGENIITTIDYSLQQKVNDIVKEHYNELKHNHIYNISCVVLDVNTGAVTAYIGNTPKENNKYGQYVDLVNSPRGTGSILKPYLYASALQDGFLLPQMLVADIPTQIAGYSPKNYNKTYVGAVSADLALARSLNVPAVRLLKKYRYERFLDKLHSLGITTMNNTADHYGLSLILGGAEASLWELTGIYASLARVLKNYEENNSVYFKEDMHMPYYMGSEPKGNSISPINASSLWFMFNAMRLPNRPSEELGWQFFANSQNIAWKTGTSFGNRDAWAIGVSTNYVVGVWVGNADGEGRPGIIGVQSAAPIMFDVFKLFNTSNWFSEPADDMIPLEICAKSGYRVGPNCNEIDTVWLQKSAVKSEICPYHKIIHLNKNKAYRVNSSCEEASEIIHEPWFVLPPVMEWYYKKHNPNYKPMPPIRRDCALNGLANMDIIYPKELTKIFIPKDFGGELGEVVFEIAHRNPSTTVYWYVDSEYLGETSNFHKKALQPAVGKHKLTLMDANGEMLEMWFVIVE